MTFAIRIITRSATGDDIVHRPRRHEADRLTIGRGSDCDIQLPDLAVSLRHATFRRLASGRVLVESTGSEPFEADDAFTTQAELDPARSPRLVFGRHVLTLRVDVADGAVLIDVTSQEVASDAAASNERRIFSLTSIGPGKRPLSWGLGLLALLLCLAWPVAAFLANANRTLHADGQWSTGPLSRAHAFLGKDCGACHVGAFVAVRDDACLACHRSTSNPEAARLVKASERSWGGPDRVALIREHAAHDRLSRAAPAPGDLVGRVRVAFERQFDHGADRCAGCHLEHLADTPAKGGTVAATGRPRPMPILREAHDCASCHARLRRNLGSTSLRDTPDWTHHPDFRPLVARPPVGLSRPAIERISLVQQPSDYTGLIFSHQQHLSTTGGVARMAAGLGHSSGALACGDCHRPDRDGKGFLPVEMTRDCAACHSLAYAPAVGGAQRLLPHGHPDQVVAALRADHGAADRTDGAAASPRRPPGLLASLNAAPVSEARPNEWLVTAKVRALFAPKGLCVECHAATAPPGPGSLDYRIRPVRLAERYLPWGDFNHAIAAHRRDAQGRPACGACHRANASTNGDEVLLPRISQCASCHGRDRADTPTAASGDCVECHSFHAPGAATPIGERPRPTVVTPRAMASSGATAAPRALTSIATGRNAL